MAITADIHFIPKKLHKFDINQPSKPQLRNLNIQFIEVNCHAGYENNFCE